MYEAVEDPLFPLYSVLAGVAGTWFFSWFYYMRAGRQLRAQAQKLDTIAGAILYYLEHPDAEVQVQRDNKGQFIGLIVRASGQAPITFTTRGTLSDASGS